MRLCLAILGLTCLAACAGPAPSAPPPTAAVSATASDPAGPTPTPAAPTPSATPPPTVTATAAPQLFTLALPGAPASLDPASAEDEASLLISRHLYEGLTAFEPGGTRPGPALAESWEVAPDGQTYTFTLRSGVAFSDGTPLTAEAARQNFERWRTRAGGGRYVFWQLMLGGFAGETDEAGAPLSTVASITATSASTLVLHLHRPDAGLPATLAMPAFGLVRPGAWDEPGFGQPGAPSAGAGPFQLAAWSPAGLVTLERNPNYWGTPARPDGLLFKSIPDEVQRVTALQVGEVDGLARLPAAEYDLAARWPNLRVEFDPALEVLYLGFNQARAPWNDLNCRLAVATAVDPARYAREFFPGDAAPADALQPPGVWGYAPPPSARAQDPAAARALWEACPAARDAEPEALTLYVPPLPRSYLPDPAGLGAAVQADLAQAGIAVTVQAPEWSTQWLPTVQSGQAGLFLLGWAGLNGDPDAYLCPLFCGGNPAFNTDAKGQPLAPDAELAGLLTQARAASQADARARLYAAAHARIFAAAPAVPLTYRQTPWAYRADLAGTAPGPLENLFFNLRREAP